MNSARELAALVDVEADGAIALWGADTTRPEAFFRAPPAFAAWLKQLVAACEPTPSPVPLPTRAPERPASDPKPLGGLTGASRACQYCLRLYRGAGYYCRPACETAASVPSTNDLAKTSKPYTKP